MLDNGGPLLEDGDDPKRMRWVKVNPHELLEGIAELSMEERGFYMTVFFAMYARMGGVPSDEHELARILRMDKRVVRRLRDLVLRRGKLYVLDGELRQRRVDHEITEYTRKAKKYLAAAAKREEERRKLAKVADEIRKTSPELLADFSETSARSPAEVRNSSDEKPNKINVCVAQILREPEPEPEPEPEKNNRPANHLEPSDALAGLNGVRVEMIETMASWISPYAPDHKTAERWLQTAIGLHGAEVCKQAFGELRAQLTQGTLVNRPIPVFDRICQRIKSDGPKNRKPVKREIRRYAR